MVMVVWGKKGEGGFRKSGGACGGVKLGVVVVLETMWRNRKWNLRWDMCVVVMVAKVLKK